MSKKMWYSLMTVVMISTLVLSACGRGGADKVEVFSWWTGGGEAAGLEAMIKVFNAQYPDTEFINAAVAGGAGTNARAVLATRLQAGDPPDSWQGHAGQELIGTYVAGEQIQPLNDLYDAQGWLEGAADQGRRARLRLVLLVSRAPRRSHDQEDLVLR